MGLDNGFICKNIKRDEIPSWVELPWDLKDKDINWRRLKAYCINNDLEIKEVDDEKFGTVKSYPIEAFKTVYPELITE